MSKRLLIVLAASLLWGVCAQFLRAPAALGDDTKLEMPKEAQGFDGAVFGKVVKETDVNGCYDLSIIKVVGYARDNRTKLNAASLTDIWKDKACWCRPEKPVNKCEPLKVGDTVVMVAKVFEAHMRYTQVTKQEEPAEAPPKPAIPAPVTRPAPPPPPTTTAAVPPTSQPAPSPAAQAQAKLQLAQQYIDNSRKDRAREVLGDIIKSFPDTDTAKAAQAKLSELGE